MVRDKKGMKEQNLQLVTIKDNIRNIIFKDSVGREA